MVEISVRLIKLKKMINNVFHHEWVFMRFV